MLIKFGYKTMALFRSGAGPIECLPEAKEAGGSYPGVGGTLTWVLSVHGECFSLEIETWMVLKND